MITDYFLSKIPLEITENIRKELFHDFLQAHWSFFLSKNYGVLGNTLLRETEKVTTTLEDLARMISDSLRAIFLIATAFLTSWQVTLIVLGLGGTALIPFWLLGKYVYKIGQDHTTANNEFQSTVSETFGAAKLILGFGNQYKSEVLLSQSVSAITKNSFRWVLIRKISTRTFEPISLIIVMIAVYVGSVFFSLEAGVLVVILYSIKTSTALALAIVNQKNTLHNSGAALEQVHNLKLEAERMKQVSGSVKFEKFLDKVVLKNVEFSYSNGQQVLHKVNLVIPKGKMIALAGKSGSGKTTLIDILMAFYTPQSGELLVDGRALSEFDVMSWRQRIGFVPQEAFLFHQSIRKNLLWSKDHAAEQEIYQACEAANANEFIEKLPDKLDTIVGDRGVRLSGGQRQRIALARALLRNPEILILDEATSALDSYSEQLIQQAIEQISTHTTVVAIAHRLSTIQKADCIYVMQDGKIIESGNFDELMQIEQGAFLETAELQGFKN